MPFPDVLYRSVPVSFSCNGNGLHGIIEVPESPRRRAVLVIVGGPQYRIGSHRQFAVLCRVLAATGVAAMRFDHRGIGDSDGATTFEHLDPDICAAIDALKAAVAEVEEVILWGLCDAASAAMMYAPLDDRVKGLVLLNPWIRTERTLARAYLKGYYASRLLDPSFWRRLLRAQVSPTETLRSFWATARTALVHPSADARSARDSIGSEKSEPFPVRMQQGLARFKDPVLLILSGEDITAREFDQVTAAAPVWRRVLTRPQIATKRLPQADHTFSRRQWSEQVEQWTLEWLRSW